MSDDITTWPFGLVTDDSECWIPVNANRELTDELRAELTAKAVETAELDRGRRLVEPIEPVVRPWIVNLETGEPLLNGLCFAMTERSR